MVDYKQKYLKYKMKYIAAKRNLQSGGITSLTKTKMNNILSQKALIQVNDKIIQQSSLNSTSNTNDGKMTKIFVLNLLDHVKYNVTALEKETFANLQKMLELWKTEDLEQQSPTNRATMLRQILNELTEISDDPNAELKPNPDVILVEN